MRQNTRYTEDGQRNTTSPSGAEYHRSGPRTVAGAVVTVVAAVAAVAAVLAPLVVAVVGAVTLTGGAVVGAATKRRGGPPEEVVH